MNKSKMSDIVKYCYYGFLRNGWTFEIIEGCDCETCKFKKQYKAKIKRLRMVKEWLKKKLG